MRSWPSPFFLSADPTIDAMRSDSSASLFLAPAPASPRRRSPCEGPCRWTRTWRRRSFAWPPSRSSSARPAGEARAQVSRPERLHATPHPAVAAGPLRAVRPVGQLGGVRHGRRDARELGHEPRRGSHDGLGLRRGFAALIASSCTALSSASNSTCISSFSFPAWMRSAAAAAASFAAGAPTPAVLAREILAFRSSFSTARSCAMENV